MELLRNREVKKMCVCMACAGVLLSAAAYFIHPVSGILVLLACLVFGGIQLMFTRRRYKDIEALSQSLGRVLHGEYGEIISDNEEGELWILRSDIRKLTLSLQEQTALLNQEKSYLADSLSDISHQLKTPLTSMNLIVSLLKRPDTGPKRQRELLREMKALLSRMEWLVVSLLKMSRMDAGAVHFQREKVMLAHVIAQAAEPLLIPMELKNHRMMIEGEADASLLGDMAWITEAVGNILKNCVEHMPQNGELGVFWEETALYTELRIEDTGSGIPEQDLPHVFERFYQSKNQQGSGQGSSLGGNVGIGLALSRMIVTEQNGTIKAENRREGGCRFTLKFYKSTI